MELVYKKDGFIPKFFACFFIVMFVVMCLVGNSVFASFNFIGSDNNNYNLPDFPNVEYNNFIICDSVDGSYINLFLLSSNDNVLLDYNTNTNVSFAYRSGYRYKIPSNCEGDWVFVSDLSTSDPSTRYGFTCNTLLYTSVDIFDHYGNIIIQANSQSTERGTGSSSDSGGSGNETTGGNTTNTTGDNTSSSGADSNTQGNTVDNNDDETDNKNFFEKILGWFASIGEFFGTILDHINPLSENFFLKGLLDVLGTGFSYINPLSDNFIFKGFFEAIGNILSYLNPFSENFFGYKIIELLKDALKFLFIPSEDRINGLINTFTSKFEFVDSIKISINSIKDMFNNIGNAPKLHLNLGKTKYTPEGNYTIIDFSWYAPYKAYGDLVLTGFIYAFFLWRLFISIPNIINGTGGSTGSAMNYIFGRSIDDFYNDKGEGF